MLNQILPDWLMEMIQKNFPIDNVYEIRIRLNKPVLVNYKNKYEYLCDKQNFANEKIFADSELLSYILNLATKQSFYAYQDQIKHGFITTDYGVRIGLSGSVVLDDFGKVKNIKNITSINIRIPHEIPNCSEKIINFVVYQKNVKNTLIISSPGAGKTTMLRDLVYKLSNEKFIDNVLVVDERNEICGDKSCFNIGDRVDVMMNSSKKFAFEEGIKVMNPTVIVTDEINKEEDINEIKLAIKSGVKVVATAHASSVDDLKSKEYFKDLICEKYFERIVVLSKRFGVGTLEGIFDENLQIVYMPFVV